MIFGEKDLNRTEFQPKEDKKDKEQRLAHKVGKVVLGGATDDKNRNQK